MHLPSHPLLTLSNIIKIIMIITVMSIPMHGALMVMLMMLLGSVFFYFL